MNLLGYLFRVLLDEFTVVQKLYPSITQVFPALGAPSRSHRESLLPFMFQTLFPWRYGAAVGSYSWDRAMSCSCCFAAVIHRV